MKGKMYMEERYKSVVCVDLIIEKDDKKILLMKRKNTGNDDGMYELPGGHLEKNEDLYDAMIRETKEELDIDINKEDLDLIYLMHHYTGERLNFIFKTKLNNLKPIIAEPNKCEELKWVKINSLPSNTTNKVKIIINDIINNNKYNKL